MIDPDVLAHYELGLERDRLFVDGRPRLEYLRTLDVLHRFLPPAPCALLDVGGATGVYALPLVQQGYRVHVVDPVPSHIEQVQALATRHGLPGMTGSVGDARALEAYRSQFDAALLLGPLYHLLARTDRVLAFQGAAAATQSGGVVVAAAISRFASLLDGLKSRTLADPQFQAIVDADLATGVHRNPDVTGRPDLFTTAYFHRPDELAAEAAAGGLLDVTVLALEGPACVLEDIADVEVQLQVARRLEAEPSLLGATSHLVAIGHSR